MITAIRMARRLGVFVGLVILFGCGTSAGEDTREAVVRDSAGITIVQNYGPSIDGETVWRVRAEPELSVGGAGGPDEENFFRVVGVRRLNSGGLVVANNGTSELRFFDANGSFSHTLGRDGSGPDEFRLIRSLHRHGQDSLAVFDYTLRRVTVLTEGGEVGRSFQVGADVGAGAELAGSVAADGFLFTTDLFDDRREGVHRGEYPYVLTDRNGIASDTLGLFPGVEFYNMDLGGRRAMGRRPMTAMTAAVAGDTVILVGTGEDFEIDVYSSDGALVRKIRLDVPRRPVTARDVQRFKRAAAGGRNVSGPEPRWQERVWDEVGFPEYWPAFRRILVSSDQHIWVEAFPETDNRPLSLDEPSTWYIFDPDGLFLQNIETPPGLMPREIGLDFVVGTNRDGMDVELVQMYQIERS